MRPYLFFFFRILRETASGISGVITNSFYPSHHAAGAEGTSRNRTGPKRLGGMEHSRHRSSGAHCCPPPPRKCRTRSLTRCGLSGTFRREAVHRSLVGVHPGGESDGSEPLAEGHVNAKHAFNLGAGILFAGKVVEDVRGGVHCSGERRCCEVHLRPLPPHTAGPWPLVRIGGRPLKE